MEIVFIVLQFYQEEKEHQACTPLDRISSHGHLVPLARVHRRVSCLIGVSERTVARIASEGKPGGFKTPTKRATWHSVVDNIDTFTVAGQMGRWAAEQYPGSGGGRSGPGLTPSMWASCCEHVIETKEMYWKSNCAMNEIDPFVVGLGNGDSDSDSDDSDK